MMTQSTTSYSHTPGCSQVPEKLSPISIHISGRLDFRSGEQEFYQGSPPFLSPALCQQKENRIQVNFQPVSFLFQNIPKLFGVFFATEDQKPSGCNNPPLHAYCSVSNKWMSPRSEISPPNSYGRYKIGVRKAQTMKQSICIHNYHPNPELKQNSKSELVSISSTISSQQTNISFPSTFSINTFNKVARSLLTKVSS